MASSMFITKQGVKENGANLASLTANKSLYTALGLVNGKYVLEGFASRFPRAKVGMTSLRFQKLSDLNLQTLEEIIDATAKADNMSEE